MKINSVIFNDENLLVLGADDTSVLTSFKEKEVEELIQMKPLTPWLKREEVLDEIVTDLTHPKIMLFDATKVSLEELEEKKILMEVLETSNVKA